MTSPFPGMDPYLEHPAYWLDFHSRFVNCWCEAVADALPPHYEASLGERVYLIDHDPEARRLGYPDVAVTQGEPVLSGAAPSAAGRTTLEPVTIPLMFLEGPRESYIEILYHPDRSLVAVLELLSPANKEYPGRTEYLAKRMALLHQNVHLAELDLLLGGHRLPMQRPLPPADYYYFVARGEHARTVRSFPGLLGSHCRVSRFRYVTRTRTLSSISVRCLPRPTNGGVFAAGSIIECRPPFFVTKISNGRTQSLMLSNVKA